MKWKSGDEITVRGYKFNYDNLDRLTAATYGEGSALTNNPDRFNEIVTYNDKMGNIGTLQRRGKLDSSYGPLDNLTYTYTGNQITKVTDAVTPLVNDPAAFHFVDRANQTVEYEYDKNGNLKKDLNRNITSITYNELNLPKVITLSGNKSVTYSYDAAGRKLSAVYKSGTTTTGSRDYTGNKVYNNGTLGIVLTEEGYATVSGTPAYYYYLKDHQGNNRVVINQGGAVQEVNHYYPFGGLFGEGVQPSIQRYKYNGKELDREFGLDMYDYGARHYDAVLGRWFTVDPLAEKYYFISPYVYVANNPVRYIDPDGREYGDFYDRQGTFLGTDGIDDGKVYILNEDKVARTENTNVNWGGTLAENHVDQLKSNSSEVSMDSELGYMMRAVYAEMRGGDDNAKAIVAESIYNRSQMKSGYEKADGTYSGIIKKFYDISKSGNGSNNVFSNPQDYIYKNDKETNAWRSSVGASIKANSGTSNIGKGVIFYNSASSTFYDKNSKMQKITLDINHRGIKGLWKLK